MGDDLFWDGIKLYYEKYRNSNASTSDLQRVMESVYKKDLSAFFKQWLYMPGQPELQITTRSGRKNGTTDIIIEQMQAPVFNFDLELQINEASGSEIVKIPVSEKTTIENIKTDKISGIIPDPNVNLLYRISAGSQAIVQAQ
jgi:aminopeptidase N